MPPSSLPLGEMQGEFKLCASRAQGCLFTAEAQASGSPPAAVGRTHLSHPASVMLVCTPTFIPMLCELPGSGIPYLLYSRLRRHFPGDSGSSNNLLLQHPKNAQKVLSEPEPFQGLSWTLSSSKGRYLLGVGGVWVLPQVFPIFLTR